MKKIFLFLLAVLPIPFLVACPGKGGGNNNTVVTGLNIPVGAYAFAGTVTNINPSCGSSVANITVSSQGGNMGGGIICQTQTGIGGVFNCPVPSPGTYFVRATTQINGGQNGGQYGGCTVQGNMQALTSNDPGLQICLGAGCSCNSQNCIVQKSAEDKSTISAPYPGSGDLKIESSNIFLSAASPTAFEVNLEASNGNNLLNTSGSWKGSLGTDGTLTINTEKLDKLTYSAQVDAALLQYAQGFCGTSAAAATKSANYARESGLSVKAVQAVHNAFSTVTARVCVYPQGEAEIARVLTLKSNSAINTNRLWFIVVEESQLSASLKTISRPKSSLAKVLKKSLVSRKTASDNSLLAEEVALGFLLKK